MSAKRNQKRRPNREERSKRLVRKLVKAVLIIAAVLFLVKIWIIPELVRYEIKKGLSKYYDGSVQIRNIQISGTGKTSIESISFFDTADHKWLSIDNMKVILADWQMLKPVISEIEIAGLNLQINFLNGKPQLPSFHSLPESPGTGNKLGLKKLTIKDISVSIIDSNGADLTYNDLALAAIRKNDIYQFQLNQVHPDDSETSIADGKINPENSDFEASLQIKHHFTKEEMSLPLEALEIKEATAEGDISGTLSITGSLKKPFHWQPEGNVRLSNWIVETEGTSAQRIFNTDMQIDSAGVHFNKLLVSDPNGDELLSTKAAGVILKNWPGLNPAIEQIDISSPELLAELDQSGHLAIPIMPGRSKSSESDKSLPKIQKLTISDAAVIVKKSDNSEVVFNRYFLEAEMHQQLYDISIRGLSPEDSNVLSVKGTVQPDNLQANLSLGVSDNIPKSQKNLIFELMKLPAFISEGGFSADLSIRGILTRPIYEITTGTIRLDKWSIKTENDITVSEFDTIINLTEAEISLDDLLVRDPNGLEWLSAKSTKLLLSEKADSHPVVTEITVSDMQLKAMLIDHRLQLPVTLPTGGTTHTQNSFLDLQKILIQNASMDLTGPNIPETNLDNMWLELERQQDYYNIQLTRTSPEDSNEISAIAAFNPDTSEIELTIQADTIVRTNELTIIQALLNTPRFQAEGRLEGKMNISGNIKKPETLQPEGYIELKDWSFASEDGMEINNLSSTIQLDNQNLALENIVIKDANDNEILAAKNTIITLENWPGRHPLLKEIKTEGFLLCMYRIGRRLHLPFNLPSGESAEAKTKHIVIPKITAQDITLGIANKDKKLTCDYLSMQPAEQAGFYEVSLAYTKPGEEKTSKVNVKGIINPESLQIDLSLQMNHRANKQETAFIFAAAHLPEGSGEGSIVADMKITGNLNKPSSLQSSGTVTLNEGVFYLRDKILLNNLNTTGKFVGKSLFFEQYSADICGGQATGMLYMEEKQNRQVKVDGVLSAEKMSFKELTSVFGRPKRIATKGVVDLNLFFNAPRISFKSLSGDGQIILDDADISVIPIIPQLFIFIGAVKLDPSKLSDAECIFGMNGPVMEIRSAHLANNFGAIEAEPGGTINLQTGNVDMYVIAVPLKQLDVLARKIPFVDVFLNLKNKLTRLYIHGHWSTPAAKLITKTPVKDIKEGTLGFFEDVARNGGQFGQKMIEGFQSLLKAVQNSKKQGESL